MFPKYGNLYSFIINYSSKVTSTGPKGIVKEDVIRHIKEQKLQPLEVKPASVPETETPKSAQPVTAGKSKVVTPVKR